MALGRKTGGRQKGTLNRATVIARTAAAKALTAHGLHEPREATAAVKLRRRATFYQQKYGLSIADYEAMVLAQGNRCAACGVEASGHRTGLWCMDRDDVTGQIRQLLCVTLTALVGWVERHRDRLTRVLAYLAGHRPT